MNWFSETQEANWKGHTLQPQQGEKGHLGFRDDPSPADN